MAEVKITGLPELTDVSDADIIPVVDDVAGTPTTKKANRGHLLSDNHTHIRATQNAEMAITNDTLTTITFDTEVYDILGEFVSGVFTATHAGYYIICGGCSCKSDVSFAVGASWQVFAYKDSTCIAAGSFDVSQNAQAMNRGSYVATGINLAAGETLRLKVHHGGGAGVKIRSYVSPYVFNFITIDRVV